MAEGGSIPRGSLVIPMPEGAKPPLRLGASTSRRVPEPPPGLDEFEQRVMRANAPYDLWVNRTFLRALLRYVRRLERDVAEGSFW